MDDKAALEDIRKGGRDGYKAIRERYERRLREHAAKYPLPNQSAENIVQEVFAQFEERIQRFNQYSNISTWLFHKTDTVIDKTAVDNIRNGGPDGYAVLRRYENTLRCSLVEGHHVSNKEVHNIVLETFASIPRFDQRRCRGKLRGYLIKNKDKVEKKAFATEMVQKIWIELEPSINSFNQQQLQSQLRRILLAELEISEESADKAVKWAFNIQDINVLNWLKSSAESVADEVTVKEIHKGQQGHTILHHRYETRLARHVKAKLFGGHKEQADDVLQNTFEKALIKLHTFDGKDCSFSTWLYRIADKEMWNILRDIQKQIKIKLGTQNSDATVHTKDMPDSEELDHDLPDLNAEDTFDDLYDKTCLEQVKTHLEREGNTDLLTCLQAIVWQTEGLSIQEISQKIARSSEATKTYLSSCKKRLRQYPPLQECQEIFLKMCLERVKAKLERDGSLDDIQTCLQAHILKLQGKSTGEVANQLGKKSQETKAYLSECQEKLMQHPAIPKECRKWLDYLK